MLEFTFKLMCATVFHHFSLSVTTLIVRRWLTKLFCFSIYNILYHFFYSLITCAGILTLNMEMVKSCWKKIKRQAVAWTRNNMDGFTKVTLLTVCCLRHNYCDIDTWTCSIICDNELFCSCDDVTHCCDCIFQKRYKPQICA